MGLTEEMRAAAENPPVPGFDLDRLMHQGHRRRVRSRVAAGTAGLLAVALAITGGYALSSGGRHTTVTPAASKKATLAPKPLDSVSDTARRLDAALATLPAALHPPVGTAIFTYNGPQPGGMSEQYYGNWTFDDVTIGINIMPIDSVDLSENACEPPYRGDPSIRCDRVTDTVGDVYTLTSPYDPQEANIDVYAYRFDHTVVTVSAERRSAALPSGIAQALFTAAEAPGLTLNP